MNLLVYLTSIPDHYKKFLEISNYSLFVAKVKITDEEYLFLKLKYQLSEVVINRGNDMVVALDNRYHVFRTIEPLVIELIVSSRIS